MPKVLQVTILNKKHCQKEKSLRPSQALKTLICYVARKEN